MSAAGGSPNGALLEARGVGVTIGGKPIVSETDLEVRRGALVAIVGPNGAGKSTLTRAVAGLQRTSAGEVRWRGEDVRRIRGRRLALTRAFVPQRPRVPDGVRVREAVRVGRSPHVGVLRRATQADHDAADRAIERAGVEEFADRLLNTLSGGELQRVQIAVALAQEAPALLADEPTSHLDLGATVSVARLLRELADEGLGVVLVAHDLALAAAVADEVVVMSGGRSVATGSPSEALTNERLRDVWGVEAGLELKPDGRTGLGVAWLERRGAGPANAEGGAGN